MKISEIKNEDALDLLADILFPVSNILNDMTLRKKFQTETTMTIVIYILKNHKRSVIEILARLEGVKVSEYNANIVQMTENLLDIMNDEELMDFFRSQGQSMEDASSGSAMETTGETDIK